MTTVGITELLETKSKKLCELLAGLVDKHGQTIEDCAILIAKALKDRNTIFWCGNGGSAAESSHLAVELIGRFKGDREPLSSLSLNADSSALTCIANDFGYEHVFARQLEGLGKGGDILIVLSSSGQSENILRVLEQARKMGITSIALLGKGGGSAASLANYAIIIDSIETARIQEMHLFIGHTFCEYGEIVLGIA